MGCDAHPTEGNPQPYLVQSRAGENFWPNVLAASKSLLYSGLHTFACRPEGRSGFPNGTCRVWGAFVGFALFFKRGYLCLQSRRKN